MKTTWTCACCGQSFNDLPMDYAVSAPRGWLMLPEAERATRAKIDRDLCMIDGAVFYVRGCLDVRVLDYSENLVWGVWASVAEEDFRRILALWDAVDVESEPPLSGWFDTWLDGYPEPIGIKCHVRLRSGNRRPSVELVSCDYPLAVEQRDGITLDRVKLIAGRIGRHSAKSDRYTG